jgi:hypothetical protein
MAARGCILCAAFFYPSGCLCLTPTAAVEDDGGRDGGVSKRVSDTGWHGGVVEGRDGEVSDTVAIAEDGGNSKQVSDTAATGQRWRELANRCLIPWW